MRRALITGLASLLALALLAPAAQAATKTRHFQDRAINGDPGEIRLDVIYKDKNGNKKFTARSVTLWDIEILPVSCNPGGDVVMTSFGPVDPIKLSKGKFNHDFQPEGMEGGLSGKVIKQDKRLEGKLNVIDFDSTPGVTNCTTDGPRTYSATPCRTTNQNLDVPVCRVGGGS